MPRLLDGDEIGRQLDDLPGWAHLRRGLRASYQAPDFPAAASLVAAVAEVAQEMDHHPDVALRWRTVALTCSTHVAGGVTQLDVELAHRIAGEAARAGATATGRPPSAVEVAIDAQDADAVLPFWRSGLGYVDDEKEGGQPQLRDPAGAGPVVWFQRMDPPRRGRGRVHLDVYLPSTDARRRVDEALAAGGRLLTDEFAPQWWVLSDAEGNELCVCTDDASPTG